MTRGWVTKGIGTAFALTCAVAVLTGTAAWASHEGRWLRVASPSTGTVSERVPGRDSRGHGAPGSIVKVTAGNLKPAGARYSLLFVPPGSGRGLDCWSSTNVLSSPTGVVLKKMTTNPKGLLDRDLSLTGAQPFKAVIPAATPTGTAYFCVKEFSPVSGDSVSQIIEFEVTYVNLRSACGGGATAQHVARGIPNAAHAAPSWPGLERRPCPDHNRGAIG